MILTDTDRRNSIARCRGRAARSLTALGALALTICGTATAQQRDGSAPLTIEMLEVGLPSTYAAEPIRADVVDEQTGFGVEGVHIVARWELRHVTGGAMPSLAVQEATSGPKGEFVIPGFPPRPRPKGGALLAHSPQLVLFKPGFAVLKLRSESRATFVKRFPNYKSMSAKTISSVMSLEGEPQAAIQTSFWNTATIGLELFNGSERDWLAQLRRAADAVTDDEAPFAKTMLAAVRAERSRFNTRRLSDSERRRFDTLFGRLDRLLEKRTSQ